jgi:hypothetical protein
MEYIEPQVGYIEGASMAVIKEALAAAGWPYALAVDIVISVAVGVLIAEASP